MDHVRHPNPMNQFFRLEQDGPGLSWHKTTRWNVIDNGVNVDSADCMVIAGCVGLDAHTNGQIHATPGPLRARQSDHSGGIGVDNVKEAWAQYGQALLTPSDYNRYDVLAAIRGRRHVIAGGLYGVVPYQYQWQKGGTFAHAFNLDDIRDNGDILVYDSLGTHAQWMPQSAIFPALEALAIRERGTGQRLFVGLTRARPAITVASSYRASLHPADGFLRLAYFQYAVGANSDITGRRRTFTRGFSAPCSPPERKAWPGHGHYMVVRILSGGYKGKWIAAKYATEV